MSCEYREEGESLFEWPLTSEAVKMTPGDLLDSLYEAIVMLNHNRQWPLTILPPRLGQVVIDRKARSISAVCLWKRKPVAGEGVTDVEGE